MHSRHSVWFIPTLFLAHGLPCFIAVGNSWYVHLILPPACRNIPQPNAHMRHSACAPALIGQQPGTSVGDSNAAAAEAAAAKKPVTGGRGTISECKAKTTGALAIHAAVGAAPKAGKAAPPSGNSARPRGPAPPLKPGKAAAAAPPSSAKLKQQAEAGQVRRVTSYCWGWKR